ncbi:MAG: PQQ-dependent sugar dehydrogenase, partial [Candidatus Kapaibacterium sp.]
MMKHLLLSVLLSVPSMAQDIPVMTPGKQVPLKRVVIDQPVKYRGVLPADAQVNVPEGFTVSVFYAGAALRKPRFMAWSPDTVLHIADLDAKAIYALPDRNDDGIADTIIAVATNVTAHSIAFYRGDLYAAQERSVIRLRDTDGDGVYDTRSDFIAPIAEGATQPGGGHTTRTILIDSTRGKIYLSIGSLCNVCRSEKPGDVDYQRALIEEWNLDGTGRRTYVTGARNAVGLLLRGGRVWASNNGSDNQGNNIPPEWIDVLRDGGFYGYPYAHSHGIFFPLTSSSPSDYRALLPLTAGDSANVASMVQPAALIQSHSAPMALVSGHPLMPEAFRRGVFVALRGSWNRTPATGGKIIYLDFDGDEDTTANSTTDFLTGFMTDSTRSSGWGWARPVGLTVDPHGRLYVGSDANSRFILAVTPVRTSSVGDGAQRDLRDILSDRNGDLVVPAENVSAVRRVLVHDSRGETVERREGDAVTVRMVFSSLPSG